MSVKCSRLDVAEALDAVVEARSRGEVERSGRVDGQPGRGRGGDRVQELATVHDERRLSRKSLDPRLRGDDARRRLDPRLRADDGAVSEIAARPLARPLLDIAVTC